MSYKAIIIGALILSGLVSASLARLSLKRRESVGAIPFFALMISITLYCWGYAFELSQTELGGMLLGLRVQYLGLPFLPSFWLILALQYTGFGKWLRPWVYAAIFIIPVVMLILHNTNEYHHLYYAATGTNQNGPFVLFSRTAGPWYYAQFAYLNLSVLAGNILYLRMLLRSAPAFRKQAAIMLAASILPWLANFIYLAGLSPYGIDINAFALALTSPFFAFAMFRYRILDLVPVARDTVFESMHDPILVLDRANRVVDANGSARSLFPSLGPGAIGVEIQKLMKDLPELEKQLTEGGSDGIEIRIESGNGIRSFRSQITDFFDRRSKPMGRILTLYDITRLNELLQKLHELATIDDLTRIYNRRQILELAQRELLMARRYNRPLSLMIMDIDCFKRFNDTYGHQAGDAVLIAVAKICRDCLRTTDIVGRYGGEEFIAIFPETAPETATETVNRLCSKLAATEVPFGEKKFTVTASFGVSGTISAWEDTIDDLVKKADIALYRAKDGGRNRVEVN